MTSVLATLDSPEKRFRSLSGSFAMSIAVLAQMHAQRDWETLTREDGSPYESLIDLAQDALHVSRQWASKMVQTATHFHSPLESMIIEGTPIAITSSQATTLSGAEMDDLVEELGDKLNDDQTPEEQAEIIRQATEDKVADKEAAKEDGQTPRTSSGGTYQPEDFEEFSDEELASFGPPPPPFGDFDDSEFSFDDEAPAKRPSSTATSSTDFMSHISQFLKGGKAYNSDEDIDTLPEELREFVRAVAFLANMDPIDLSSMVDKETRGVLYKIDKAKSNLIVFKTNVESAPWVLANI